MTQISEAAKRAAEHINSAWSVDEADIAEFSDRDSQIIQRAIDEALAAQAERHKRLIVACQRLISAYEMMPDGPLGRGLVNGDFLEIRNILREIHPTPEDATE